ncbi:ABC transporter ATP-binding protein [Alicyclobacillus dauci]|uniref:ABC transporter ATP-binding protein n=1 Tax=Alicyclobacillus dauci TaxID=1475485 RepID=A0ABY6Z0X0_9BACL|nr:ABC transporter ATP-binding protein [Alicyclobacillus dauci]WAH36522.1 ABC transporter ATP-binding protein [Alicyclobacillus dauci]
MQEAILLDGVSKRFGDKTAVDNVTFSIEAGSIVALLGPNGAGKTTVISMMLGLAKPTAGNVRAFGQSPNKRATRKHYGVMLQQVSLPPKLRVRELVNLFRSYYDHPLDTSTLLKMADLEEHEKKEAVKLSGGQQRRLQYALAMAGDPRIVFLDEPTTGMDVTARRSFWENLRAFAQQDGRTIILTTHHLEEADAIADRILLMQNGRITADGTVDEIKLQAGNRYVAFMAGPQVQSDAIAGLPYVAHAQWSGRHVRIRTKRPDDVLRAAILRNLDVSHFEVSQGHLEDAFVSLTEASAAEEGGTNQ